VILRVSGCREGFPQETKTEKQKEVSFEIYSYSKRIGREGGMGAIAANCFTVIISSDYAPNYVPFVSAVS
jgi:hypothetical protein